MVGWMDWGCVRASYYIAVLSEKVRMKELRLFFFGGCGDVSACAWDFFFEEGDALGRVAR